MMLEEEFIITIPDAESEKILSIEDAVNFISVSSPAPPPAEGPHVRAR